MKSRKVFPCCLTIAGSDSGGNAGVQADLRAFHTYSLHGCTVFTALTAQNPFGVSAIHSVPPAFIAEQLDAVLGTYDIKALKTGMIGSPEAVETVAERLVGVPGIAKVIDPVMIATSGARLISDEAISVVKRKLLPLATLITPNLPEAEELLGNHNTVNSRQADAAHSRELAKALYDRFGAAVLVKGGHGANSAAVDVLFDGDDFSEFTAPWIANPASTHGTGCSLAAALASELALGQDLRSAVAGAKEYVHRAIAGSYCVGPRGCAVLGFIRSARRSKRRL